jgi:hypothetical protein
MNISQGSLVMVGLNTTEPKVFWNGQEVPGIVGITASNTSASPRVVLNVAEDPLLAEMQAAGIIIRRV